MGRIKRPVPNIRGGGAPVPGGLFDSTGTLDPYQQDPNASVDPYANYGLPDQAPQMACGGIVNKPTVVRVGESGPEKVVKLRPRMSYQRKE